MNYELSSVQSDRKRIGTIFEDITGRYLMDYAIEKDFEFGKSNKRVSLKETQLTFDSDFVLFNDDKIIFIEVKKSISDSTIAKLYCQYQAWFEHFMNEKYRLLGKEQLEYEFLVITSNDNRSLKYLSKLKELPLFKYCTIDNVKDVKSFTKVLDNSK